MMAILWQDIATASIVIAALGYLAYRIAGWIRRKGLPGCSGCASRSAVCGEEPLVTLGRKPRKEE